MNCKYVEAIAVLLIPFASTMVLPQSPAFSVIQSTKADRYGTLKVTIRNNSSLYITAAHITHICTDPSHGGQTTSTVGFDTALNFSTTSGGHDLGMAIHTERYFDILESESKCPEVISVIFSDGRCEGSTDEYGGCTQDLANRLGAYKELEALRSIIQSVSDDAFLVDVQAYLESRRTALSNTPQGESVRQGNFGRELVVTLLKRQYPPYTTVQKEFSTPDGMLKIVDAWMKQLSVSIVLKQD